jgi:6-phosphogluconolactonase
MSNAAAGNEILGFTRGADGSLTPMAAPFLTGGAGSGAGLGEQGAVAYDTANNRLYAVNAGDDSFSILPVDADGALGAAVKIPAAGGLIGPKSITFHGDVVYVLYEGNATTPSSIAGYMVSETGATAIPGSTKALSSATQGVDPAEVLFTPDGSAVVVTEKQDGAGGSITGNGMIDVATINASGAVESIMFFPTASGANGAQKTPYGFAFAGSTLVVAEAGATGAGVYTIASGSLSPVTGGTQFMSTDPAPCWVATTADWAYVANAKGPDVSGFTVSTTNGSLTAIGTAANAVVATTGTSVTTDGGTTIEGPTDESISADGEYLYVLDPGVPAIGIFAIGASGALTRVGSSDFTATAAQLPPGVVGLAAR